MRAGTRAAIVGLAALAGLLAGLAACEDTQQRRRLAACRQAIPAIETQPVRVLHAGSGPAPGHVRVDYVLGTQPHWVICRFDAGTEVTALATDRAVLSDSALYLLKRYWLSTPDAARADPGG